MMLSAENTHDRMQGRTGAGSPARSTRTVVIDKTKENIDATSDLPMTVPGSVEQAAKAVEQVSPEGRPADGDAKSGPGRMVFDLAIAAGVMAMIAVGIGLWFGWLAGLASMAIGLLALLFNPVVGAVVMRAGDRAEVVRRINDGDAK